jgi:hypothetical protein
MTDVIYTSKFSSGNFSPHGTMDMCFDPTSSILHIYAQGPFNFECVEGYCKAYRTLLDEGGMPTNYANMYVARGSVLMPLAAVHVLMSEIERNWNLGRSPVATAVVGEGYVEALDLMIPLLLKTFSDSRPFRVCEKRSEAEEWLTHFVQVA